MYNMMWMGTDKGVIQIFDIPTLKIKFTCTLGNPATTILEILHVKELCTVLVANFSGEVWSFRDTLLEGRLKVQSRIELKNNLPACYHLAKVCMIYFCSGKCIR